MNGSLVSKPEIRCSYDQVEGRFSPETRDTNGSQATDLREVQLHIAHSRALDRLGRLLDDTLREHDALRLQARSPLQHVLADLLGGENQQGLDGVDPLAQVEEDHLAALRTRRLDARAHEHGLAVVLGSEGRDLDALAPRARLGLVQRQLAIKFGGEVLQEEKKQDEMVNTPDRMSVPGRG